MSTAQLIPDPEIVRTALAESSRETKRLRELLKISERAHADRNAVAGYRAADRARGLQAAS